LKYQSCKIATFVVYCCFRVSSFSRKFSFGHFSVILAEKLTCLQKRATHFEEHPEHLFFKKVKNSSKFWQTQDLSRNSRLNSWIHAIQNQSLFLLFGLADTRRHDLLFRSVIFQFSVLCNEDGAITTDSIFLGKTLFWYFNFFNSLTWLDFEKIECNVMGDQWLVLKCC
jgi:hypothetical protein